MAITGETGRWRDLMWRASAVVGAAAALVLIWWALRLAIFSNAASSGSRGVAGVALGIATALVLLLLAAALDTMRRRWWLWIAAILLGLVGVVLLVWRVPQMLYSYAEPKDRAAAEASTRTGVVAGLAGLAALIGLTFTARTYRITEQGHITDRYTKAIDQLGDDKLGVRLGGIYALERIAVDSKRDHPTVVEVLSAFIRERSAPRSHEHPSLTEGLSALLSKFFSPSGAAPAAGDDVAPSIATDVQAALTVLGRLPSRTGVARADLQGASLRSAFLAFADFAGASFIAADLTGVVLFAADLTEAVLVETNLSGATLIEAELIGANLDGAELAKANLDGVDLRHALLTEVNLTEASLAATNLEYADLTRADLSRANFEGTNLIRVEGLTQEQINGAVGNTQTRLPRALQRPAFRPPEVGSRSQLRFSQVVLIV